MTVATSNAVRSSAPVGAAMRSAELSRWRRRLGAGWDIVPRLEFGRRYGLASVFPGPVGPDVVAVHRGRRHVLVGDVAARPDRKHLRKTIGHARRLAARMPPSLAGYRVLAQDWYWAPPSRGDRTWARSWRITVARPRSAGEQFARVLPELAEAMVGPRRRRVAAPRASGGAPTGSGLIVLPSVVGGGRSEVRLGPRPGGVPGQPLFRPYSGGIWRGAVPLPTGRPNIRLIHHTTPDARGPIAHGPLTDVIAQRGPRGHISINDLMAIIPRGTPVAGNHLPSQRLPHGFKVDFPSFYPGPGGRADYQVRFHPPDPGAPVGSNSNRLWTAQIAVTEPGERPTYLTQLGTLVDDRYQDITHIPLDM